MNTKAGEILVFSYVGMLKQEIVASNKKLNVKMTEDTEVLEGVVVTALGIKRENKPSVMPLVRLNRKHLNNVQKVILGGS
ncbi:hypothetical protein [Flavobacterium piscinae]|uniref:hypothetical protein n=1 Tax=Flavobacterium piscinae TaxID=2506424 RepID=UPI002AAC3C11|nr:hypothetical protein [Flavobacterium piscinae]